MSVERAATARGRLGTAGLVLGLAAATTAAVFPCPGLAAPLVVNVTDRDGRPAIDVAVVLRYATATPASSAEAPSSASQARQVLVIDQRDMRFQPFLTIATPATTLLFTNRDDFDHHIVAAAMPPAGAAAKGFETRLPPDPTRPFGIQLTEPGGYALSCHLHSRMRAYVLVTRSPWFAKTDARGQASFGDVPPGAVEVVLWHPEQFSEQVPQRAELGSAVTSVSGQLNFVPRRRRAP
jgi:plastocyanin